MAVGTPLDDELGLVLTGAADLNPSPQKEARLLVLLYRHDQADVVATELPVSALERSAVGGHSVKARAPSGCPPHRHWAQG